MKYAELVDRSGVPYALLKHYVLLLHGHAGSGNHRDYSEADARQISAAALLVADSAAITMPKALEMCKPLRDHDGPIVIQELHSLGVLDAEEGLAAIQSTPADVTRFVWVPRKVA